jgi:vacuolar protein sorting-associated protein 1
LTKPDTLTGASETRLKYKVILEGRAHRLKHGYYAVRLPSEDERSSGMQRATFTQRSSNFFEETEPWSFMHDRSRFGIPNLVTDISRLLVMRIEERFASSPKLLIDELSLASAVCRD